MSVIYGSNLADNRLMVIVAPPSVAKLWCEGLQVSCEDIFVYIRFLYIYFFSFCERIHFILVSDKFMKF